MLLVEPLRRRQRASCREPVARVRLALQRRQVVQHRRALFLLFLLQLGDLRVLALARLHDRHGLRLACDPRFRSGVEASDVAALRFTVSPAGAMSCAWRRSPADRHPRSLESPRQSRVNQPVRFGLERPDLLLAAGDDRQRRRLHAAERDRAVERAAQPDRGRPRGVHADDPVGLRARARRLLEFRELRRRAQLFERLFHRRVRHRVQPQPPHGLLRFRLLVQIREDQLPLAAGVAGVDDLVDVVATELFGDNRHLLARALVADDELELLRHDRQVSHPPGLELRVVLVRVGELHEVPDRPRNDVVRTLQKALLLLERPLQYARQVPPH